MDATVPTGVAAGLGVLYSAVLVFVTKVVYEDGEFSEAWYLALFAGLIVGATVVALTSAVLLKRMRRIQTRIVLGTVLTVYLGALIPGFAFSYTGFSGFGTFFFLASVLAPTAVLSALTFTALAFTVRGKGE